MTDQTQASLTSGPVGKILFQLTLPMVFGILSIVLFNLADTYFVGHLGTRELAALSFTFPVVMFIQNLALGLGIGASAVISRAVGEGDTEKVKRLTTDSLVLSGLIVIVFILAGLATIEPVFRMLGAPDDLLPLIKSYMIIWYPGVAFVMIPMVGNNAIRARGDTRTPSLIMMTSAAINLVIDPLLIFGVGPFPRLEIAGAALSTVFARAISMSLSLYILGKRDRMLTTIAVPFRRVVASWKRILYVGIPSAATRMVYPVGLGIITRLISQFGPESVAAYGVASRIEFFAISVLMALASVMGPFVGQNRGAGHMARVKRGVGMGNRFAMLWGLGSFAVLALAAPWLASLFNPDPEVIRGVTLYLRIVPVGYGLQGMLVVYSAVLNVLNRPISAALLSMMQMFVLYVPLAFLGARLWGMPGVFGALAVSYISAGVLAHLWSQKVMRKETCL